MSVKSLSIFSTPNCVGPCYVSTECSVETVQSNANSPLQQRAKLQSHPFPGTALNLCREAKVSLPLQTWNIAWTIERQEKKINWMKRRLFFYLWNLHAMTCICATLRKNQSFSKTALRFWANWILFSQFTLQYVDVLSATRSCIVYNLGYIYQQIHVSASRVVQPNVEFYVVKLLQNLN